MPMKIADIHEAVLEGSIRSDLSNSTAEQITDYSAFNLATEYAHYESGQRIIELIRQLDARKYERHAVILSIACCAKLISQDPTARIRNMPATEYITQVLLAELERHRHSDPPIALYIDQIHVALND